MRKRQSKLKGKMETNLNRNLTKEDIQLDKKNLKRCSIPFCISKNAKKSQRENTVYPHDDKKYLYTKLTVSNDFDNKLWAKLSVATG